jgi:hypothetical protein
MIEMIVVMVVVVRDRFRVKGRKSCVAVYFQSAPSAVENDETRNLSDEKYKKK